MNIPSCLNLELQQREKLAEFEKFVLARFRRGEDDNDCCGSSNFTFHMFGSGIGDVIWVTGYGFTCPLSLDDDGDIIVGWDKVK